MLKFLRKYQVYILVVGGAFLMVAFLVPQLIQSFGQTRDPAVATMDGEKVMNSEIMLASAELQALDVFNSFITRGMLALDPSGTGPEHWFLLTREAEQGGFVGGPTDGQGWIPELADEISLALVDQQLQQMGLSPSMLPEAQRRQMANERRQPVMDSLLERAPQAAASARLNEDTFYRALAKARGVLRMVNAYAGAPRWSGPALRTQARIQYDGVLADTAFLDARALADTVAEPTEDELRAHFERFRDVTPAEGEFGVGYTLPPRVKLEWIALERPVIEDAITIDAVDASKHWQLNRDRFPGEFSAEREAVTTALRGMRADQVIAEAERTIRAEVLREARNLPTAGDYTDLPDDWAERRPSFEEVAGLVQRTILERQGVNIPMPTVTRRDASFLTADELRAIPGFGTATIRIGANQVPAPLAVFRLRELEPWRELPIQVGLTAAEYPAIGPDGTEFVFRVLDARRQSPPDSMDEIRERIVADARAIAAYEALASRTEELRAAVIAAGGSSPDPDEESEPGTSAYADAIGAAIAAAGLSGSEVEPRVIPGLRITRATDQSRTPRGLAPQETRDQVMGMAERLDPRTPADEQPLSDRVFAMASPAELGVGVGVVTEIRPLTIETYRRLTPVIAVDSTQREFATSVREGGSSPFSYQRLAARHDFAELDRNGNRVVPGQDESEAKETVDSGA